MKKRKMAAPIAVSAILILLYGGYIALILWLSIPVLFKLLLLLVPLALIGVVIFVLRERIKEIRSGEEDDLSQY